MFFVETRLEGVRLIELEPRTDERGFFARTWCREEFGVAGLDTNLAQQSLSHTRIRGTMRGLHCQRPPLEEIKLVRCVRGAIFDVVVDIRPHSPTYLHWQGFDLSANNHRAIYIPGGFAHGFQTLVDETDVLYDISVPYVAEAAEGYRFDDACLAIDWPLPVTIISDRDRSWPLIPNPHADRHRHPTDRV